MVMNLPANAGDLNSIPGLGRLPGGGNSNPFKSSCLGNPIARGAWLGIVHGIAQNQTELVTGHELTKCTLQHTEKAFPIVSNRFWFL